MGDIIVVGNMVSDFFLDTEAHETMKDSLPSICYPVGAKIAVKDITLGIGGGGFNTSVTFAKMGLKPAFYTKLTNDLQGKSFLNVLKKEGVSFIGSLGKGVGGYSVILDSEKHHRTILTFKGKDNHIDSKGIKRHKAKWFYFASMKEKSLKAQQEIAKYAKKIGAKVAYNASEYLIKAERKEVLKLVKLVDVLILNKEEAELLSRSKEEVGERLIKLGPKIICVTNGAEGVVCFDVKNKRVYSIIPHNIKVKEPTGAGDAFASGFVSALVKGEEIKVALEVGLSNSESVISHFGATNKVLKWGEALKSKRHRVRVAKW